MFPYDSELLSAVGTPPATIDGVVARLQAIDGLLFDVDGLKWFNWLYLRVTEAVRERIAAPGGFTNPPWIAQLDVQFARHYFNAVEAWLAGRRPPGCWRALLARRDQTAIARIQFALAGVNAHINHDLPVALIETLEIAGLAPHTAGIQYNDYTSLNSTLEAQIAAARSELMVRLPGEPLPEISRLEETLAAWSVAAAREAAWTNAELLWDVREIPLLSGRYLDVLDGLTTVAGKTLLVPVPLAEAVAQAPGAHLPAP